MFKNTINPCCPQLAWLLVIFSVVCQAQDGQDGNSGDLSFQPPCRGPVTWADSGADYADFDFWVGEWLVFDRAEGRLMGLDRIENIHGGCALMQHWRQLNDRFALPGSSERLKGSSQTGLGPDGLWHQVWVDNTGSYIPLAGGLDDEGRMVLDSGWLHFLGRDGEPRQLRFRWHWAPQADGSVHNWGHRATGGGDPEWLPVFDIVYRPNVPGGPTALQETPAGE